MSVEIPSNYVSCWGSWAHNYVAKPDKPVRTIEGIDPGYAIFNSSRELIATNCISDDVVVFDKKGQKKFRKKITQSKYKFENVCGVAVDKADNIYISDDGNQCVYKFNKKGDLLKKFEENDSLQLTTLEGIAVAGDRVLVCDSGNKRVQVLTTELEPVNVIEGLYNPLDIAVDDEQMLYIADDDQGVKVYTMDGQFSRCFSHEQLVSARGVCVDSGTGFVYVSDWDSHCVFVFTRDGQFVTSFGDGHVTYPGGVTVDSDGFVYVCNTNGVTVF